MGTAVCDLYEDKEVSRMLDIDIMLGAIVAVLILIYLEIRG